MRALTALVTLRSHENVSRKKFFDRQYCKLYVIDQTPEQ